MKKIIHIALYTLLVIVLYFAVIIGLFFKGMNWDFHFENTHQMTEELGEVNPNTQFTMKEIKSVKLWIIKTSGIWFKRFQNLNKVHIYNLMYKSNGHLVSGIVMLPKTTGPHPCVIYNRGGNRNFGRIGFKQISNVLDDLVAEGYVVIASNYQGNNGGQGKDEFGGTDVANVENLINILGYIPQADTSKIGMYGVSRGGMMTYEVLKKQGNIKAAVVKSGSTNLHIDLTHPDTSDFERYVYAEMIPDYYTHWEEELNNRSAVKWADQMKRVPLLMLHGNADKRVLYQEASELASLLEELNYPFQLVTYQADDHFLSHHRKDAKQRIIHWFDTYLKNNNNTRPTKKRLEIP